jgi:hypothetical protein
MILHKSRICCLWCNLSQKRKLLRPTPHRSIPPSNNWNIWMFTQIGQCVLTQMWQCYLKPKRTTWPSPFCLGYFSSSKNFNYIAKNASIFHLKLGNSDRPNYFSISTPLKHTPHCHDWFTTSCWLLRWRVFDI